MASSTISPSEVNSRYTRELAVIYALFLLVFITTILRVYTRAYITRSLQTDDFLIIISLVFAFVNLGLLHAVFRAFRDFLLQSATGRLSPEMLGGPVAQILEHGQKMFFYLNLGYILEFGITKMSILFFYLRLMRVNKPYRITIYSVISFIMAYTIGLFFATIFQCKPVSAFWKITPKPQRPMSLTYIQMFNNCVNITTDLIVLALPIRVCLRLQMSWQRKFGMIIIFALGALATAATTIRLAFFILDLESTGGLIFFRNHSTLEMLTHLELRLAMFCANAPALAALWRELRKGRGPPSSRQHELGNYPKMIGSKQSEPPTSSSYEQLNDRVV